MVDHEFELTSQIAFHRLKDALGCLSQLQEPFNIVKSKSRKSNSFTLKSAAIRPMDMQHKTTARMRSPSWGMFAVATIRDDIKQFVE